MDAIREKVRVKNNKTSISFPKNFNDDKVIILSLSNNDYEILQWQKDKVRKRSAEYHKNPNNVTDIEDFFKEIEIALNKR